MSGLEILVSGAGVAGPVLAHFLTEAGAKVTIVERASGLRVGGQNVDIRGLGQKILEKMHVLDAVRRKMTREAGVAFVDTNNRHVAKFAVDPSGKNLSITAEIEIMRGDLAEVLYAATKDKVEYKFGDSIASLSETEHKVKAGFQSGSEREFDLVIAADGLGSATRKLVFGGLPISSLGQYVSWFSIPREEHDSAWATWYNAPKRRLILLRPNTAKNTESITRASIWICTTSERVKGYSKLNIQQQKTLMHELFHDAGGEITRCLTGMDNAEDFFMQEVAQVKIDSWSKGRVALVGDAAFCPSPISGMGTTLAIVGSYILAGEIAKNPQDPKEAFGAYERILRPFVNKGQKLFPGAPQLANPDTAWGIRILHLFLRFISWSKIMSFFESRVGPPVDAITLPEYGLTKRQDA